MLALLIGYIFLFIVRPFEYWPILGVFHLERLYALLLLVALLLWGRKRWLSSPLNIAIGGFFFVMLLSTAFAYDRSSAVSATINYVKLIVLYVAMIAIIQREEDLRRFVHAYLTIMALYVWWSAWEFFVNDRHSYRMGIRRMMGVDQTYGDPNSFAASIVYSLPFLWMALRTKGATKRFRALLYLYGALAAVAIVYSGSRSAMVTGLLFLGLVWLDSSRKALGMVLLAFVLVGVWIGMPESYKIRFISAFVPGYAAEHAQATADASARGRIEGLILGYRTFLRYPALGIGPGNFKYAWGEDAGAFQGMSAHNLYGQLLGELGGGGAVAFAAIVLLTFRCHNRIRRRAKPLLRGEGPEIDPRRRTTLLFLRNTSVASMQALVLLLFNGNFGHNLFRFNYLWLAAFAVISLDLMNRSPAGDPPAGHGGGL